MLWRRARTTMSGCAHNVQRHLLLCALGDFDGDVRHDVLFQTPTGTFLYRGTGAFTNPFTPNVWVRNDLPLSYDEYALGDLNGDYRTDLWITTPWASHGYYGSFSAPFISSTWTDSTRHLQEFTNHATH